MARSLRGIGSCFQIGALREVTPALVVIRRILRIFPLLHRGLRVLFTSNHFDDSIRAVGADVVPDDRVACVGFVACQRESIRSVPNGIGSKNRGPPKTYDADQGTATMLRATRTIGNQFGETRCQARRL